MVDPKTWKLFRCVYDEMGQFAIEGEWPEGRFEKSVDEDYGEIGYLIGTPLQLHGHTVVRVELEGSKENLEYVLELMENSYDKSGTI